LEKKDIQKTFEYMLLVDTKKMSLAYTDWETVYARTECDGAGATFKLQKGDYKMLATNVKPAKKNITSEHILDSLEENSLMKTLKTPLRYPGGKSRACVKMDPYFPDLRNYDEFREPFIGGGSVAIYITKKYPSLDIWVNDLYEPLVNFWQQLQMFGYDLNRELVDLKTANNTPDKARELFLQSKEQVNDKTVSNFNRAVAFYVINKCSFSGLTESSSFSEQASNSNFSNARD